MPPFVRAASRPQVRDYFRAIAVASGLPVFIQNYHGYPAAQLTVDAVTELVCSIDGVSYVKEEALPAGQRMSELIERAGSSLEGVMGGLAGRFMIDEFARGACGTMPACEITDVHVAIWRALEAGDARSGEDHPRPRAAAADHGVAVRRRRLQGGPPATRDHRSRHRPRAGRRRASTRGTIASSTRCSSCCETTSSRPIADAAARTPERVQ